MDINLKCCELIKEVLLGSFILQCCKVEKDDKYHNQVITISRNKPEHSILCPLQLILVLAIQKNRVAETTSAALFD
jgi:hypothetical protein